VQSPSPDECRLSTLGQEASIRRRLTSRDFDTEDQQLQRVSLVGAASTSKVTHPQ
jgi:hypothetical protein